MRRRTFVGLAGTALTTAVAGCLADVGDAAEPSPEPSETPNPPSDSPGGAAGAMLSDDALATVLADLPEVRVGDYPTVTYTPGMDTLPPVYFAPEAITVAAPTRATFTLHNDSDEVIGTNPARYALYRLREPADPDGTPEWKFVGPEAYAEPWLELNAGHDLVYSFIAGDPPAAGTTEAAEPFRDIVYDPEGGIDPGIHALCVFASVGEGDLTTYAAPFVLTTKADLIA